MFKGACANTRNFGQLAVIETSLNHESGVNMLGVVWYPCGVARHHIRISAASSRALDGPLFSNMRISGSNQWINLKPTEFKS